MASKTHALIDSICSLIEQALLLVLLILFRCILEIFGVISTSLLQLPITVSEC